MLLLSATAVVLGLFVVEPAVHFVMGWGRAGQEERFELEKEFYLASTVVVIILAIRLFAIPLYFWTMQDLVPMIPGAMCLWGVFNAQPALCWSSLFLKLFLPIVFLGWIIVYEVNNECKHNPLMMKLMVLFLALLPLLLLDSVIDLSTFLSLSPVRVACCSNAIDVWPRAIPSMVAGLEGQYVVLILFYLVGVSLLLAGYFSNKPLSHVTRYLTLAMCAVTVVATIEVFTPFILHTPLHFCPFCLFFQNPVSILFAASIWVSISSPWWVGIVDFISRNDQEAIQASIMTSNNVRRIFLYSTIIGLSTITFLLLFSMMT